jgi:predicted extracellular nuclease
VPASLSNRNLVAVTALALLLALVPLTRAEAVDNSTTVWINEIHYDNTGTDAGEAIEVAGLAGTNLTDWSIVLYNGSGGAAYDTQTLTGTIPDEGDGFGTISLGYPVNGIQNGAPDGIALVDDTGALVQFLSYEGTFTGVGGAANGVASTDIGASEGGAGPVGNSLALTGTGTGYADFAWTDGVSSFGSVNSGQTFGEAPELPDPWINEFHYDNDGADTGEAIEVAGAAGTVLNGWSLALYNGSGGALYDTIALTGTIPNDGDGFGVISATATGLQNGSPDGIALVDGSGVAIEFISYEGAFTAVGGPADGMASTDVGVSEPANSPVGVSLQLAGAGTDPAGFTWVADDESFGCINSGQPDLGTTASCNVVTTDVLISAIQGTGDISPLAGQSVTIEGIVVGDFEGASPNLQGFYVQEEDSDQDGNAATSEAVFVFHGSENTVSLGDRVSVTSTVAEFQGQTQLGFPAGLTVTGTGTVTPTSVTLPVSSSDFLERYEGMAVTLPQTLYVSEMFQLGRFGQVVVSSGGILDQPTAVAEPGAAANAVQAANDLNRLIIDDGNNAQNADPIRFGREGNPLTASNTLRGGDTLTGATGVMTYTWAGNSASGNAFRVRPSATDGSFFFAAVNDRPDGPPKVGGSLKVASFNVLNYFLTLNQSGNTCGPVPQECRGANNATEFDRQREKLMAALSTLNADVVGLMELENTPGVSPEADIVAGLNDVLGAGTYAYLDAGVVGTDAIRVGLIYKPGKVTPIGPPDQIDFGDELSRTSLAQTFRENSSGEVFTVVVNHLKSKSCTDATGADADQGDGQGCWNQARVNAANQLVAALATLGHGDKDFLLIGDFNSYDHEDPIDVIKAAGFTDLAFDFQGEEAYSYVFDGQWGYLDYGLASASLAAQVTGTAEYHINSDEPSVLDYNTEFKTPGQVTGLFAPNEFRTSDHDPVVIGLKLKAGAKIIPAIPLPFLIVIPNHDYRQVTMAAVGKVEILGVTSSEADSGLGKKDKPNDIVILDANSLKLRAEAYSSPGRSYTIGSIVTHKGQTRFDESTVFVLYLPFFN